MSAREALRVGWCPGALRPMPAGDGLILRVKPRGGALTLAQAAALADLARRYGNGAVTLTARANIQLRGMAPESVGPVTAALARLDLLDPSPETEAVRNVVSSPLAGHDARALIDVRPVATSLENLLRRTPAFWRLPAKFAWVVDDGGSLPLDFVPADVRFEAQRHDGQVSFEVRLGTSNAAARCLPDAVGETASALAGAFLALRAEYGLEIGRMRDLLATCSAEVVFDRAGLTVTSTPRDDDSAKRDTDAPVGFVLCGARSWVGAAPPFGWFDVGRFADLIRQAEAAGADEVRLTPWRSIIVPGLAKREARALWDGLSQNRGPHATDALILDPADPRLTVSACAGAPACHRATTAVRTDAARLARAFASGQPGGTALHVSGCAKGCAHPGVAPITLVGRDGLYDLVRNGTAADAPDERGLSAKTVAAMLGHPQPEPAC